MTKNMKPRTVKASELKKGYWLKAKDPCIMNETGISALIVGKGYPIIDVVFDQVLIASEISDNHLFRFDELSIFFDVKVLNKIPKPIRKNTQRTALIKAFIDKPNLTAITAFKLTGSMKLSTRVPEFEEMGLKFKKEPIQFKTRYGTSGRYVKYTLVNKSVAKKLLKDLEKGNK